MDVDGAGDFAQWYAGDLAEDDIAVAMGVTGGTVASTLAAARRSLAGLLAEPDVAEEPS